MKLPNGDKAEISVQKLVGYCLNPNHSSGKNKARVFASALGITADNFEILYELIQKAALEGEIIQENTTEFGQQYKVDWIIPETENIKLRTIWEISRKNCNPRLISAFIK
ncbi:MAG: DUF6883 domain-containing protein [Waterburya sp.]